MSLLGCSQVEMARDMEIGSESSSLVRLRSLQAKMLLLEGR